MHAKSKVNLGHSLQFKHVFIVAQSHFKFRVRKHLVTNVPLRILYV